MEIVPLITSTLRERAPRAEPTYRGALRRPLHLKNRRAASDPHRATLGLGLYRIPSRVDVSNTNAQRSKTPLGPPPRTTLKSLQCRTIHKPWRQTPRYSYALDWKKRSCLYPLVRVVLAMLRANLARRPVRGPTRRCLRPRIRLDGPDSGTIMSRPRSPWPDPTRLQSCNVY